MLDLAVPDNAKSLKKTLGMFAYYAQWISEFSDQEKPLVATSRFPLNDEAVCTFNVLKDNLANATLGVINHDMPFTLETDASEVAISATLNHIQRPIAFYSRTLNSSEVRQAIVEKEACTIVEAVRH